MSNIQYKILVTGVAGFLGSHLSEQLSGLGHKVIGIDIDEKKIKSILSGTGLIDSSTVVANLLASTLSDPDDNVEEQDTKKPLEKQE